MADTSDNVHACTHTVTTVDICTAGFERWRRDDEYILVASVFAGIKPSDVRWQLLADLNGCERPDWSGHDWRAAHAVCETMPITDAMFASLGPVPGADCDETCNLYVYVRRDACDPYAYVRAARSQ